MNKKITIIGTGMDGSKTLTSEAFEAIRSADALISANRIILPFSNLEKPVFTSYKYDEITVFIHKSDYKNYAVLMSGDCGFFSGCTKLKKLLGDYETDVICGISSPVYFSAKLGIPWFDWHFVSLHGKNTNIVRNVCAHEKTFFLLGGEITASEICRRLCEYGMGDVKINIGENLAYENERLISGTGKELVDVQTANLSVLLAVNSNFENVKRSGIPDDKFIRGSVPMTKSEVRAICISRLNIADNSVCWDIGCGTGSVSVEMAIQCPNGTVFAVDRSEEAVSLTEKNRLKFCCDNIEIIHSDAENTVDELPAPDCVFVGGSGGKLRKIIHSAYAKNPDVTLVVTAVSIETLQNAISFLDELNLNLEVTQVAVTRTKKVGAHTMLAAENPIFIIKGSAK